MKVVIDTNLLVAAFFNKSSYSAKIIRLAERSRIRILWTEAVKKEANFILGNIRKSLSSKNRFKKRAKNFKNKLKNIFKKVNKIKYPPKVKVVKKDPQDNKFIACAVKGGADLIISNDKHLLDVKEFKGIPIFTSKKAYKKISRTNRD